MQEASDIGSVLAKEWYSGGTTLSKENILDVVRRMCQNHKMHFDVENYQHSLIFFLARTLHRGPYLLVFGKVLTLFFSVKCREGHMHNSLLLVVANSGSYNKCVLGNKAVRKSYPLLLFTAEASSLVAANKA